MLITRIVHKVRTLKNGSNNISTNKHLKDKKLELRSLSNFSIAFLYYVYSCIKLDNSESIAGRVHDRFFQDGAGFRYLVGRNKFGNGRHPETYEGHGRYMGENGMRVMIGYNNMYGYRRNVPKLRTEPPSTFNVDPRCFERLKRAQGDQLSEEELIEHFKHTYLIGYPFYDNNFNNFHPSKSFG